MSTKSTRAPARSKVKPTSTSSKASNISFIHQHRTEESANDRRKEFLDRLSDEHHDVVMDYLDVIWGRNTRTDDTSPSGQVISFPASRTRKSKSAKGA